MSITPWLPTVKVYNSDTTYDVDPQNIPINDLIQRTQSLYERLNGLEDKNAVIIESAAVDETLSPGTVVYWNTDNSYYQAAHAAWSDTYGPNGELQIAEAGMAQGIALDVPVSGVSSILIGGSAVLTDAQMLNLFGVGVIAPGLYFLSATDPGMLTLTKPVTPVPILYYQGLNKITLKVGAPPEHNHIHKNYLLTESWFDTADPRFEDMDIPVGALWGYDVASDTEMSELFISYPGDFTVTVDGVINNQFVVNTDNVWYTDPADPNLLGEINTFITVPYNYGQPIVRAIWTEQPEELSITGINGVVLINNMPWVPQVPGLSATAVSSLDGRDVNLTSVVSAIYPQGSGIRVYSNPTTGEHVLDVGQSNLGNVYAETINMNNAMQVTDGAFVLLTFPEDRLSSMTGVIPLPKMEITTSGFHYEMTIFVEQKGITGATVGVPIDFPEIDVDMTFLEDAESAAVDIGAASNLVTTVPAVSSVQGMKYYTQAIASMSVSVPGTLYVTLEMPSDTLNKSLFGFGVYVELVAD